MSDNKYPFFKAASKPITDIFDHFKFFISATVTTALFLLVLSFLFSQTFLCMLPQYTQQQMCSQSIVSYLFYIVLKFFFLSVFLKVWYDHIYSQKAVNTAYFKNNFLSFLKFMCFFVLYLLINCLPALSLYLLIARVPNPSFVVELCYFTFVSLGFIVPFVLIRFYTDLACLIEGQPLVSFKELFLKTSYKTSKIILSFLMTLVFCFVLFLTLNGALRSNIFEPIFLYNVFAEFLFEFSLLFVSCAILNFIRVQKEIFQ